jgi:CheY-like chemotaxis protein
LMMPVMDGWAFRAEQRARPGLAGVPVVVVSAARDLERHAAELGAAAAFAKPFALAALIETVARLASGPRAAW